MIKLIKSNKQDIDKTSITGISDQEFVNHVKDSRNIVAFIKKGSNLILLDKENSQLKILDNNYKEIKTIGSRLSFIAGEKNTRLGFEFPEDILSFSDKILISDSGNKRIVIISEAYKLDGFIELPDSPYKFIYSRDDLLIVSDFSNNVFIISLKYGYIGKYLLDEFIDFSTVFINGKDTFVADETGNYYSLFVDKKSVYEIAKSFNNKDVQLKILLENKDNNQKKIRSLIEKDYRLIFKYIRKSEDYFFNEQISLYIRQRVADIFIEDTQTVESINRLSLEYLFIYKILNTRGDTESGSLINEQKVFEIFNLIKYRRLKLEEINEMKLSVKNNRYLNEVLEAELKERRLNTELKLKTLFKIVNEKYMNNDNHDDETNLTLISEYWLLVDEQKIIFSDLKLDDKKIREITNVFYNQFLKNYYYNISILFLRNNNLNMFYFYAEKELELYSDKIGIMLKYVTLLINQHNYARALEILSKNVDRNKEHINYKYYQIYKAKGDYERAFNHIKKELELFPHKKELISELLSLNIIDKNQVIALIDRLLENSSTAIDSHYNIALSLFEIEEIVKGEDLLNRELELFPENTKAVILKMKLMLSKLPNITEKEANSILKIFVNYLKTIPDDIMSNNLTYFFYVLNFIEFNEDIMKLLNNVNWINYPDSFQEQIEIYYSFLNTANIGRYKFNVKKFDIDIYMSSYSTSFLAFEYFFKKAKKLIANNEIDKGLNLIEKILKYNAGNKEIFEFLDSIK